MKDDEVFWKEITRSLSRNPKKPKRGPVSSNGAESAIPRAKMILDELESSDEYKGKTVLIIAHDGICRDIIYAKHGKRTGVFDLCEVRDLDKYGKEKRRRSRSKYKYKRKG
jgi:broad specificity phosphatase PhoE